MGKQNHHQEVNLVGVLVSRPTPVGGNVTTGPARRSPYGEGPSVRLARVRGDRALIQLADKKIMPHMYYM